MLTRLLNWWYGYHEVVLHAAGCRWLLRIPRRTHSREQAAVLVEQVVGCLMWGVRVRLPEGVTLYGPLKEEASEHH